MHFIIVNIFRIALVLGLVVLGGSSSFGAAKCYDVSKAEPATLFGHLTHRIFPGPPGFSDVQKGDTPEPGYILKLAAPICITGDDFADPEVRFNEVQLVPSDKLESRMLAFNNLDVDVSLSQQMAAETGHHHRPLVAWVTEINSADDPTQEYGTAATTVRAFYTALSTGDGELASGFIVPERRTTGPLSAQAMTTFYGGLVEPLQIINIQLEGRNRFRVKYLFKSATSVCNGTSEVRTISSKGRNLILSIKALNGC